MSVEADLSRLLMDVHPAHAARVLEELSPEQAAAAVASVTPRSAARVVEPMEASHAASCVLGCPAKHAAGILAALPVHRAALLLRGLPAEDREQMLLHVDVEARKRLRRVLAAAAGTAGSLMDPLVVAFPGDVSVGDALRRVRRRPSKVRFYVFVTDRDQKLVGVLTLRELMVAPPRLPLSEIACRPVERLHVRDGREVILAHAGWARFHALPVVDDDGHLVGVLRYETFRELQTATPERPPDLLMLGSALTKTWVSVATLFFDGFSGALVAGRPASSADRKDETP